MNQKKYIYWSYSYIKQTKRENVWKSKVNVSTMGMYAFSKERLGW